MSFICRMEEDSLSQIKTDLKQVQEFLIEYLKKENPEYYKQLVDEGFIEKDNKKQADIFIKKEEIFTKRGKNIL